MKFRECQLPPLFELVKNPKDAVHVELLINGEATKPTIAREECPTARSGKCEGKSVGDRQIRT